MNDNGLTSPDLWLARFAKLVVAAAFALLFTGGHTTTSGAGMAFPDWPLSNGSLYPAGWMQNPQMLLEHGHRGSAGLIATLVTALFVWVWARRKSVTDGALMLASAALAGVLAQAVLGGLRVILDPQGVWPMDGTIATTFRVLHGCFAQVELCLLVAVAALLSPVWRTLQPTKAWPGIGRLAWFTSALIFIQLIVGATMRHLGAGLAIPTFPAAAASGALLPSEHNIFTDLNFAHTRVGSVIVALFVLALFLRVVGSAAGNLRLVRPAALLVALTTAQAVMGILIILQQRPLVLTTFHVVNGAAVLATAVLLGIRATWTPPPIPLAPTVRTEVLA